MRGAHDERTMRLKKFYGQFSRVSKPEEKINTFATVAPSTCKEGLYTFLYTLSLHNENATVYIISDKETRDYVEDTFVPLLLNLVWDTDTEISNPTQHVLPEYDTQEYVDATNCIFPALRWALDHGEPVLYCSPFTVVINTISIHEFAAPIGVVERGLDASSTAVIGNYSTEFVYIKDSATLDKWQTMSNENEACSASITLEKLQSQLDFEWLDQSLSLASERMLSPLILPDCQFDITRCVRAKSKTLRLFFHKVSTVVLRMHDQRLLSGISAITSRMHEANLYRELCICARGYAGKWVITLRKGGNSPNDIHFRRSAEHHDEFLIEDEEDSSSITVFNTLQTIEFRDSSDAHSFHDQLFVMRHTLFNPNSSCLILPSVDIPTNSEHTEAVSDTIVDREREYLVCCCINSICSETTTTQLENVCDLVFDENSEVNVAQKLVKCKYGLFANNKSVSSTRLIDLMAVGTVPILLSKTAVEHAPYPLTEDKHYIHCESIDEIKDKVNQIDDQQWINMSLACRDWYIENAHSIVFLKNIVRWCLFDSRLVYHRA